jgi:DNA-binding GntR family transcriptional regulator
MAAKGVLPKYPVQTKVSVALETLRESILEGGLKPGERLLASDLAEALDMSPTPVREALRILEAEGLVTSIPHRGAVVSDLAAIETDTFYALRAPMESLATRLAVPRLTEADIEKLEREHARMKAALQHDDDKRLTKSNSTWHTLIYEACGSPYLMDLIRRLWMPFHWRGLWADPRRELSVREHGEIMEAIKTRQADEAARLMQKHIEGVHRSIVNAQTAGDS